MSETIDNPRAIAGSNKPPLKEFYEEQNAALPAYLEADNTDLTERTAELLAGFDRAPEVIDSEEMAGKMSDFIAQIGKCVKNAEAKRVDVKAGPLTAGRLIDGFFQKSILDKLAPAKTKLLARLTAWEQKKAAEERRKREEVERAARAAAAEAERVAREEAERVAAVERAEREKAEKERLAAEAAQREREKAMKNEKDMAKAIELAEENKRLETERNERLAREQSERDAQAKIAADEAATKRALADKAAADAVAKASTMHTTRGDMGSSSSLRTVWVARIENFDDMDLNKIRDFIATDAIQKALNAYVKLHKDKKPLAGVQFAEETAAVVRG